MTLIRVLVLFILCSIPSQAQYFNRNALQLPLVGWMGLGTTAPALVLPNAKPWQSSDQVQPGFGYMHAIWSYNLWWIVQTAVTFGFEANTTSNGTSNIIIGLNASSGLRYNFMTEYWRPFLAGQFEYLQFFHQSNNNAQTYWLCFLLGPGVEWIFADDMGLQLETGAHILSDFSTLPRFVWSARLSYQLYF